MTKPRILLIDIETLPNIAYVWGKWEQNVIEYVKEGCIATYAAKWLGEPVFAKALPDFKGYKANSYDDEAITKELWKLLDEADIVVAHNGDDFDIKVIKGRFIVHGLLPPAPFKTVDTKKLAKVARFNSNKLDDLGKLLGIGQKIKTDFSLWKGCIEGDENSWKKMIKYNKLDVILLEKLYLRLRPFARTHPNMALYGDAKCPKCGGSSIQFRGFAVTTTRKYRRFACNDCGSWGRVTKSESGVDITNG